MKRMPTQEPANIAPLIAQYRDNNTVMVLKNLTDSQIEKMLNALDKSKHPPQQRQ